MLTLLYNQPASAAPPPPPPPPPPAPPAPQGYGGSGGGRTTFVDPIVSHRLETASNLAIILAVDALVASGVLH